MTFVSAPQVKEKVSFRQTTFSIHSMCAYVEPDRHSKVNKYDFTLYIDFDFVNFWKQARENKRNKASNVLVTGLAKQMTPRRQIKALRKEEFCVQKRSFFTNIT